MPLINWYLLAKSANCVLSQWDTGMIPLINRYRLYQLVPVTTGSLAQFFS
jgi:hypothetical protein